MADIRQELPRFDRRGIPLYAAEGHWRAADGALIRRIDWPVPDGTAKGSLLFLPGRGDFYEKYLETLDHWYRQGWRVTGLDWRGQAGSGRLGADGQTGHIDDFSTWVGDLAAFWAEWIRGTPGPHILSGHSMGGHLCLRAAAERAAVPDALVLSAPMLGFLPDRVPPAILHLAARLMCVIGDPMRPAWKWSEKPGQLPEDRIELLTHDADRYADEVWWREARPELAMGPGSWGWVERAYASNRVIARTGLLEALTIPVHIVATSADRLVAIGAIERAAMRLPQAELVRFGAEARHEILREADAVRDIALRGIDAFLDTCAARAG